MKESVKTKFAQFLANESMGLLLDHLDDAEKAALESIDANDDKPVKARIAISYTWEAGKADPKVITKINYTTSHKDETERTFDPNQINFEEELDRTVSEMTGQ